MLRSLDEFLAVEEYSLTELWDSFQRGELSFSAEELPRIFLRLVRDQLAEVGPLLGQLLALSLFSVLLSLLQEQNSSAAEVSRWVVYLMLLAVAILAFDAAVSAAREAVTLMKELLAAAIPILLPILAALGGAVTTAAISPLLLFAVEFMMLLMGNFIFPLLYLAGVLRLVGCLAPRFPVSGLADLFNDVSLGVLSILSTVFVAVLGFVGVASASVDGVTIKAAKTAAGAFIPVVGRTLSDVFDSVLGTAMVLKSAIGFVGVVAVLLICAVPAIRLLIQSLVFRLVGALIQPLGEKNLSTALTGMGKSLTKLFAALAVSGLFSFFALAFVVSLGVASMMIR